MANLSKQVAEFQSCFFAPTFEGLNEKDLCYRVTAHVSKTTHFL